MNATSTTTLLLAEDDFELRTLIRTALEHDGHSVVEAKNGADLLEEVTTRLLADPPRDGLKLIVSDVWMPGWTGLEILQGLRSAGSQVPWLLISGFADESTRAESARLGAMLLEKPFELDALRAAVRALCRPHVVLAEDDARLRGFLAELLRDAGYEVTEAADGLELVEFVRAMASVATRPAAIVTDVRMPRLSGLGALELLSPLACIPTVVMTASATPEIRRQATRLGAVVVEKPAILAELVETVGALLSDSKLATANASPDTADGSPIPRPARQRRILLVEDDAELRALLRYALQRDGHEVWDVAGASELLALDEDQVAGLDVIVTDIRMPGVSGLDLLGALRAMGCATPVVVMTAFGDASERSRALRMGAFAFLDKPFEVEVLSELVHAAIEHHA